MSLLWSGVDTPGLANILRQDYDFQSRMMACARAGAERPPAFAAHRDPRPLGPCTKIGSAVPHSSGCSSPSAELYQRNIDEGLDG